MLLWCSAIQYYAKRWVDVGSKQMDICSWQWPLLCWDCSAEATQPVALRLGKQDSFWQLRPWKRGGLWCKLFANATEGLEADSEGGTALLDIDWNSGFEIRWRCGEMTWARPLHVWCAATGWHTADPLNCPCYLACIVVGQAEWIWEWAVGAQCS